MAAGWECMMPGEYCAKRQLEFDEKYWNESTRHRREIQKKDDLAIYQADGKSQKKTMSDVRC